MLYTHSALAQTTDTGRSMLTTPGDDGCRGQVLSTVDDDDRHLLITVSVQLCVQLDVRLGMTASRGPLTLAHKKITRTIVETVVDFSYQGLHYSLRIMLLSEFILPVLGLRSA